MGGQLASRSDSAAGHCQAGGRLGGRWPAAAPGPDDAPGPAGPAGAAGGTDQPGGAPAAGGPAGGATGPAGGADAGGVLSGARGGGTQVTVGGWSAAGGCAAGGPGSVVVWNWPAAWPGWALKTAPQRAQNRWPWAASPHSVQNFISVSPL